MPLVSQTIPNLIGGVSQQPDSLRRVNQCTEALNVFNDPVNGASKRSGSQHIASISSLSDSYYGSIERDEVERYIFGVSPSGIRIWDAEGVERTVTAPGGYGYLGGLGDYRYLNIADTTFIVNPQVVVQQSVTLSPASTATGLIFIRAIDYDLTYTVNLTVDANPTVTATYTSPVDDAAGSLDTSTAASNLATQLDADANITAVSRGPVISYTITGTDSTLDVESSLGEDFITGIPGEIENFGDLPKAAFEGVIVKVAQNSSTSADDYFVRFDGKGWVETIAPQIPFEFDATTMPHVLIRQSDGSFTFETFEWTGRLVGDVESNPNPSFVGNTISNIFFERNRLGFLSDVNCILSGSSDLANFYRTTVSTIVDSDVIDISMSGRKVDKLNTAIGVKDGILLFSEETQFLLSAGEADILSPETATITSISSYRSNTDVDPERVGDSILFITRRANNSGVREYLYQSTRDFTQSASITNHIPTLLPAGINNITGSSTENIVFFTADNSQEMYVYQYLYDGDQKVISSWVVWRFNGATIKFVVVFDDFLYLLLDRQGEFTLERLALSNSFRFSQLPSDVCLDEYVDTEGLPRSLVDDDTVFTIDKVFSSDSPIILSTRDLPDRDIFRGDVIQPSIIDQSGGQTSVTLAGDWTTAEFIIGTTYSFVYEFSQPYLNIGQGDVEIEGRTQVRNVTALLEDTGDCDFRVIYSEDPNDVETGFMVDIEDFSDVSDMSTLATFSVDDLGGHVYPLSRAFPDADLTNRLASFTYSYRIPIMSVNTGYRLRIESNSWQSLTIAKAQVEAMYHKRSRLNG